MQALEVDLETYEGMVAKLHKEADKLAKLDPEQGKEVKDKQRDLESQLEKLQEMCANRRHNLEEAKNLHMYMRESDDLEEWINDQMQIASSEDYGQDFEHLQVNCPIQFTTSFVRLTHRIQCGVCESSQE